MLDNQNIETIRGFNGMGSETPEPIHNEAELAVMLNNCEIDYSTEYAEAPPVLSIGEQSIGHLGDFTILTGKAKSRKTFFASAIAAAALRNRTVTGIAASFPDDRRTVLYFDCEQSKHYCSKVQRRIVKAAGTDHKQLMYYSLRPFSAPDRIALIDHCLRHTPNVGLVIIDGIRDLVTNINNETQATELAGHLMKWTDEHQIHIVGILHQNKADTNARGHVGTEVVNKGETVLSVTKDDKSQDISIVKSEYSRDKEITPFAFAINQDGVPELIDDYIMNASDAMTDGDHTAILKSIFNGGDHLTYKELQKAIKNQCSAIGKNVGDNKIRDFIQHYQNQQLIIASGTPNSKNRKYSINNETINNGIPF